MRLKENEMDELEKLLSTMKDVDVSNMENISKLQDHIMDIYKMIDTLTAKVKELQEQVYGKETVN